MLNIIEILGGLNFIFYLCTVNKKMKRNDNLDEELICKEYTETRIGTEALALKYHTGKLRIKEILNKHGISIKKRGMQPLAGTFVLEDYRMVKYPDVEGKHYVAIDKISGYTTKDYMNRGGFLTSHIEKVYGIPIPSLRERQTYYRRTGNYWWEQWFDIRLEDDVPVKKCPMCDWTTRFVTRNTGAFTHHLEKVHGLTKEEYLEKYPEDKEYFYKVSPLLQRQMFETDQNEFVCCAVCGKKLRRIDRHHLERHGLTKQEYIDKYGPEAMTCKSYHDKTSEQARIANENMTFTKNSADELEIMDFIKGLGFDCMNDRHVLHGKELDIYIPAKQLAIEYNGNMLHSEKYGKEQYYHLAKTEMAANEGVGLIHIFEDEYHLKRDIVLSKIRHTLGKDDGDKIPARKCEIREIGSSTGNAFLETNHIQGGTTASIYIGAFFSDNLVAVMAFLNEGNDMWNLVRFASDITKRCQGIGGKLFKWFTGNYYYKQIKSFADRRWTLNAENNIYTRLGFKFEGFTKPDYRYYNPKVDRFERFHKFRFRKQILAKKYGLPLTMTEREMTEKLGYDKIWDCGLIKYVYYGDEK